MRAEPARKAAMGFRLLLASALALGLTACPGVHCPTRPFTAAAPALARARVTREPIRSMSAEARVDQRGTEGRIRGTVLMMLERPGRLRFDAMTQFGPAAVLTSDGPAFELLDQREGHFLHGRSCPSNIARLLGVALSGEDLSLLLTGDSPHLDATNQAIACTRHGTYLVTLTAADGERQELEYEVPWADRDVAPEAQHLHLRHSEQTDVAGHRLFRVTYDDYRDVDIEGGGSVAMPFAIHFVAHGADTLVRFRHIDVGTALDAASFQQEAPPGIRSEEVLCDETPPDPAPPPSSE